MAGIEPVEENTDVPGVDGFLSNSKYDEATPILMSRVELDVTFKLEDYAPDTKTYYFTAENRGPVSGTSNYFYGIEGKSTFNGTGIDYSRPMNVKAFPTQYLIPDCYDVGWSTGGLEWQNHTQYNERNYYWEGHALSRDDLRAAYNELFGTNYEPLGYSDPEFVPAT